MRLLPSFVAAVVVAPMVALACGEFTSSTLDDDAGTGDASLTPDADADASPAVDAASGDSGDCWARPFGTPVAVAELNSEALELSVRLSPDERTAFLASNRDGGAGGVDLYVSTRASRTVPFSAPTGLPQLNTAADETHPTLSFDGLSLYFGSTRLSPASPAVGTDIYVARRGTSTLPFNAPSFVPELSGTAEDSFPYAAPSGGMYLASNRSGEFQIFFAAAAGAAFAAPEAIPATHEPGTISNMPVVSADGLWLYFASSRGGAGALGELDIWLAHRPSLGAAFGPPVDVTELNTPSSDRPSWISPDGCRMYLTSTRSGGLGDLDVWRAER